MPLVARLATPPLPLLVPDGVFDAFGWCDSDELEWRRPDGPFDLDTPIDGSDPTRLVFVFHHGQPEPHDLLPRELARLHTRGLDLGDAWALAPYAIDDATDTLFEKRLRPRDVLWLAADNLNALFWGLHDWAHFHNHGTFETPEQRAWTELQCDAAAVTWLWLGRNAIGLDVQRWERLRDEVASLRARTFEGAVS